MTKIAELREIGTKIHKAYSAVIENITEEEVEKFGEYLRNQEAIMPLFDPTGYMGQKGKMLEQAKGRYRALADFFGGGK